MVEDMFKGRYALVTGGSRGIGKGVVDALRERGCKTAVMSRNPGDECDLALPCDVADEAAQQQAFAKIKETFGHLDYAFINAGQNVFKGILDMTCEDWDKVLDINLRGAFIALRESARLMTERGGCIVTCGSLTTHGPERYLSAYSASKAAIAMLSRVAAQEFGEFNIRVNCVVPGFIRTDMTSMALEQPEFLALLENKTPLKRVGEPADIAKMVLALFTMDWVTSQVVTVDGGLFDRSNTDFLDAGN